MIDLNNFFLFRMRRNDLVIVGFSILRKYTSVNKQVKQLCSLFCMFVCSLSISSLKKFIGNLCVPVAVSHYDSCLLYEVCPFYGTDFLFLSLEVHLPFCLP